MILHIVNDEKFIDMAFRIFEEVHPHQNECIVLSSSNELTYIKSTPCTIVDINQVDIKKLVHSFKKYDGIVLHGLDNLKLEILKYLPKDTITIWIGFGYDYYDLIVGKHTDLFDSKTKSLYSEQNNDIYTGQSMFRNDNFYFVRVLKKLKCKIKGIKTKKELINKVAFFAPVLNEEYTMVEKSLRQKFKPQFLDWNYGTLEDDLIRGYQDVKIHSNNILVGNSASYENNHIEIFELLEKLNINDRKIISPLSYGKKEYREEIKSAGEKIFQTKFVALTDFIPIDKYIEMISSCSVVIMNHIRQQALGNIVTMMYLGAVIILKEENPVYKFFKKEGVFIYSMDELENEPKLISHRLTKKEIDFNRRILKKHWSRDVSQQKTKNLIEMIFETKNA